MKCRRKVPIDTQTRANTHAAVDSRVLLSQTKAARATQTKATLTGESKEKAHSLLKTLSPVLGTLMVGMNGTSSSPRSAAIFAFLLLAPQCRGATGAALSEQRMLFLKHPVSTFLRPGGCDAENHKNKMTEGWRLAALFFFLQNALTCAEITSPLLTAVTPLHTREYITRRAPPTPQDDS